MLSQSPNVYVSAGANFVNLILLPRPNHCVHSTRRYIPKADLSLKIPLASI